MLAGIALTAVARGAASRCRRGRTPFASAASATGCSTAGTFVTLARRRLLALYPHSFSLAAAALV